MDIKIETINNCIRLMLMPGDEEWTMPGIDISLLKEQVCYFYFYVLLNKLQKSCTIWRTYIITNWNSL